MSVACESEAQRWRSSVQVFNLRLKVKDFSADRVYKFQTAVVAAENAREEKTVFTCGRCRSGAKAERDTAIQNNCY